MTKLTNRRRFIKQTGIGVAAFAINTFAEKNASLHKPNIIYILADDAGIADFGCYGGKIIMTPNIDRMAKEGMKFTQHYSGSTVCAPSRSCLMSGLHTGHTRVRGNSNVPFKATDITVAEALKKGGYTTGCVGKWGLGLAGSTGTPNKKGFDYFYGFLHQGRAHRYYPAYLWYNDKKVLFPKNPSKRTDYAHDHFTNGALNFIHKNKNKPFFLYIAYTTPHVDLDVPEDSMKPYYAKFGKESPRTSRRNYRAHPTPHACYAGMISRMDRDIGKIFTLLKKLNIDENTLVIFTSDNGATGAGGADPKFFKSNGSYRGIKRSLYEGGIICPHIARWPSKIKAGTVSDHLSAFWDFFPTATDVAGLPTPNSIDGISYLPTLLGKTKDQKIHKYLYWEFFERGGKQAVRKGKWKAVRPNISQASPTELYDLSKDQSEKNNVAKQYPKIVQQMEKIMLDARTESKNYKFRISKKKKRRDKKRRHR